MVLNFAHRGSLTEGPENTLPAMKKALEHGAKAIELDVQLTKDQQLVVIHDHKLTRFNKNAKGLVKDYTLAEIKEIDVGSSFSDEFAGTTLATLDEILEVIPKEIVLNIEIKNIPVIYEGIEETLWSCLKNHQRLDNLIISSFDHVALEKMQRLEPGIPLGLLFYYRILKPWDYARQTGLEITSIHPHAGWTDKQLIDECQKLGYQVYPFTVNKMAQYHQLVELGVDGVFSNNPKIFTP
ncbi:glycerophosphoryl diester phosphodiesterase [Oceanobacillus limi]|uniref:Glycerophosphoryl diester phosphodiesterase n=1 Tax=Oceanobacillus limi TaxID=930131 RepID=A0A1I0A6Y4_9BACI|nr:glycerophosphodiester phosphodiesterase family protein [Oceanobacillus limi]SES88982.1 glycerophosphoryl diester phosphodiesterase [Oceanobacillus limi]